MASKNGSRCKKSNSRLIQDSVLDEQRGIRTPANKVHENAVQLELDKMIS